VTRFSASTKIFKSLWFLLSYFHAEFLFIGLLLVPLSLPQTLIRPCVWVLYLPSLSIPSSLPVSYSNLKAFLLSFTLQFLPLRVHLINKNLSSPINFSNSSMKIPRNDFFWLEFFEWKHWERNTFYMRKTFLLMSEKLFSLRIKIKKNLWIKFFSK